MKRVVVTIARQYGSGGREIGEKVAELLGVPKYDKEFVTLAASKDETVCAEALEKVDERATNSLLYTLAVGSNLFGMAPGSSLSLPLNDKLFVLQSSIIRQKAEEESCVMIGRCADYVLRDTPERLAVFVYADLEERKRRVANRHGITEGQAVDMINKTDRRRASYYNFYTGGKWGKFDNYDIAINSACLGIEGTARIIADMAREKMNEDN